MENLGNLVGCMVVVLFFIQFVVGYMIRLIHWIKYLKRKCFVSKACRHSRRCGGEEGALTVAQRAEIYTLIEQLGIHCCSEESGLN